MSLKNFQDAVTRLKTNRTAEESEGQYMSDINHYVSVHVTQYMPRKNEKGEYYIPSTAMATDYQYARNTVHTTLNHAVQPVFGGGDWENMPYVILAPFKDMIATNGKPAMTCLVDTYFSVSPDRGLVLPPSTHIIRPAYDLPDGKLFEIRGNETVYKQIDYTDAEIELLKSHLSPRQIKQYDNYLNGCVTDTWTNEAHIAAELEKLGESGRKLYDAAKDKTAFLRGLFENSRDAVLGQLVRDIATRATMEQMGYRYIDHTYEYDTPSEAVEKTALSHGMDATTTNKAHSNSLYSTMEDYVYEINSALEFFANKNTSFDAMLTRLSDTTLQSYLQIRNALLSTDKPKFYAVFQHVLNNLSTRLPEFKPYKTIADFDANLDKTIQRYCAQREQEFQKLRTELKQRPGYDQFIQRLAAYQQSQTLANDIER